MTGERPVWLNDEPELAALLNAVLDRFDHQAGESRQKAIVLPLARHLKSLARADTAADQSWALLQDLQNLGVLSIRQARRSTYDPEWQEAKVAFAPDAEETLRRWLGRAPAEPVMQVWRRAVAMHAHAFANSGDALAQQRIVLDGRTAQEVVAALARIGDVRGAATLRQLSAFAFWGDSKALDGRGELIAALFPRLEVRERTIVVAVFLPVMSRGVLFIENQDTYTAATRGLPADLREFVLVYASGFRSAASRIRSRTGALLHYAG
ncbi:hypothetical protein [Povalibacter sp.]|uniref:hypothetical protein n=1 Tax=Povalibacter sp. TaxID=1962978 RepID=UPI002F41A21C